MEIGLGLGLAWGSSATSAASAALAASGTACPIFMLPAMAGAAALTWMRVYEHFLWQQVLRSASYIFRHVFASSAVNGSGIC
ncbi:unnamed protein product [Symbiodinium natans]|uniref:Uncharacterized protein n=1 Tax=Symbiodinium natans TaxID=878477 RepID=A0A812KA83_9DINO|nr:unnamed protein product [Symbiodinium natans]